MRLAAVVTAVAALSTLPGGHSVRSCAAAGPYWPTMTLALQGGSAWVACKEEGRLIRIDVASGHRTASVRLAGQPIAVASGLGAVWALDGGGTLYRVDPVRAKVTRSAILPVRAAYNLWIGGGSVWTADDQGGKVARVSAAGRVLAQPDSFGDGPADIAFHGNDAWVINHRDKVLSHIDLKTSTSRRIGIVAGDAPERMVWASGALWVTGRGTDLLRVDPHNGDVLRTIDIGASGIDVALAGTSLLVPTRSDAVDRSGFPTMDALKRVSIATGRVTVVSTASGRVDVHGIVGRDKTIWLSDNTNGFLYRFRVR